MDCDDTLLLEEVDESSDSTDDESRGDIEPCAVLRVPRQGVFGGAEYTLSKGFNMIGRSGEICNICIPSQVLSKKHACIVVQGSSRGDLVYDLSSRNGTKRGKMRLEPDIRYELRHGDRLYFGGLECIYSRLDLPTTVLESPFPHQTEASRVPVAGKLFDTSVECCSDSDISVDMLQIAEDLIDPQDSLADNAVDTVSSTAAAISSAVVRRTSVDLPCSSTPNATRRGRGQSFASEQLIPKPSYGDDDIYNMATQACTLPVENDADETLHKLDDTVGPIGDTVPFHHDEDGSKKDTPIVHMGEISTSHEGAQMAAFPHVSGNAAEQDTQEAAIIQQAVHATVVPSAAESESVDLSAPKPASSALALETTDSDNESTLLISDGEDTDSKGIVSKEAACRKSTELAEGIGSTADDVGLQTGAADPQRPQRRQHLSTAHKTAVATPNSGSLRNRGTGRRNGSDGIPLPIPARAASNPSINSDRLLHPHEHIGASECDSFVASSSAEAIADADDNKSGVSVSSTLNAMEASSDTALASCASAGAGLLSKSSADADTVPYNSDDDKAASPVVTRNLIDRSDIGHSLSAAAQQQQAGDIVAFQPTKGSRENDVDGSMPSSAYFRPVESRSELALTDSQELPVLSRHRQKAPARHVADISQQLGKGDNALSVGRSKRKGPVMAGSDVLNGTAAAVSGEEQAGVASIVDVDCPHPAAHRATRDNNPHLRTSDKRSRSCNVTPSERAAQNEQNSEKPSEACSGTSEPVHNRAARRSRAKVSDSPAAAACEEQATARTRPGRRSAKTSVVDEGRTAESTAVKLLTAANSSDGTTRGTDDTCAPDRPHSISSTLSHGSSTVTSPRSKRARCNRVANGGCASVESAVAVLPSAGDNEAYKVPPDGGEPKNCGQSCDADTPANPRCSKRRTEQADDLKPIAPIIAAVAASHEGRKIVRGTAAKSDVSPANKRARKTATSEAVVTVVPEVMAGGTSEILPSRPAVDDAETRTAPSSTSVPDKGQQRTNRKTRPTSVKQAASFDKANEAIASSSPMKEVLPCEAAEPRLRGAEHPQRALAASAVENTSTPGRQGRSHTKQTLVGAPVPSRFPQVSKPKIMFTGISETEYHEMIRSLGGCVVDSVSQCTHLVTDEVRRTFKFLCAVARGIPIVTPQWLTGSSKASTFLDVTQFLLRDKAKEKLYGFSLPETLERAQIAPLFKDFKVHATKSVKPPPEQIKEVVALAGGCYVKAMPKPGHASANTIIISCPDDVTSCKSAATSGISVVTAEFLLTGILRHQIDTSAYALAL